MSHCVVVISHQHPALSVRATVEAVLQQRLDVIVVDSTHGDSRHDLAGLPITLLRTQARQPSATALFYGMQEAVRHGAELVVTLDSNIPQLAAYIPQLVRSAQQHPATVIIGTCPERTPTSTARYTFIDRIGTFLFAWLVGHTVDDSASMFRLYPTALLQRLPTRMTRRKRLVFEREVLVEASRLGYAVQELSISAADSDFSPPIPSQRRRDNGSLTRILAWRLIRRGFYPTGLYRNIIRPRLKFYAELLGGDGTALLLLSNAVIVASAGSSLLWLTARVYRTARNAQMASHDCVDLLVLGLRLHRDGSIRAGFQRRLECARELLHRHTQARVFLLGGRAQHTYRSEAQAGFDYLCARGIAAQRIVLEDGSRSTLENLRQARALLNNANGPRVLLITNRYHLERAHTLAQALRLEHALCAAEANWQPLRSIIPVIKDAYHLHWFMVGHLWARLTANDGILNRSR